MLVASQMWCLACLLPLMIGHKVPVDDDHWSNFLMLLSITDLVFAPTLSSNCLSYLKDLICEHHETFKSLYPACSIIPKMHYMVHYPECIERYVILTLKWYI